mmetsp:Transcript_31230/g.83106  ORF Transcript_31230/g.83106 Transcript_31230/m.83106 type:complete len:240 (+) Transcript_31230:207-926(+)
MLLQDHLLRLMSLCAFTQRLLDPILFGPCCLLEPRHVISAFVAFPCGTVLCLGQPIFHGIQLGAKIVCFSFICKVQLLQSVISRPGLRKQLLACLLEARFHGSHLRTHRLHFMFVRIFLGHGYLALTGHLRLPLLSTLCRFLLYSRQNCAGFHLDRFHVGLRLLRQLACLSLGRLQLNPETLDFALGNINFNWCSCLLLQDEFPCRSRFFCIERHRGTLRTCAGLGGIERCTQLFQFSL